MDSISGVGVKETAGLPVMAKDERLSGKRRQKVLSAMAAAYKGGCSKAEIGSAMGRSEKWVGEMLREAGVTMRTAKDKHRRLTLRVGGRLVRIDRGELLRQMREKRGEGCTHAAIGALFGRSEAWAHKMVSEAYGVAGGGWRGAMGARDGVSGVEAEQVVRVAVGIEMRRWREERGLSRAALATRLQDVEKHVLYTYETGRRSATVARLARICGELGVEPSRVLSNALRRVRVAQWDVAALRRAAEEARGV